MTDSEMKDDEIEVLYLVDLQDTPMVELQDRHYITKWLERNNLPTTPHYVFLLSRIHLRWWTAHMKEVFKK